MAKETDKTFPRFQPLSPEETVAQYTPLVQKIATSLARRNTDPLEDLIQVGMIGLLDAAKRYDPKQPASFKTYATHCVTGSIRHYLRDKQNLMRGPRSLQELSYRLQSITGQLNQQLGREPTHLEVAEALQITVAEVQDAQLFERRAKLLWLDQEFNEHDDDKHSLMDSLSLDEHHAATQMDTRILIDEALGRLAPIEQSLLRLRYFDDLTQTEIAKRLELSQMEVCRKLKQAEKKLKTLLYDFVD